MPGPRLPLGARRDVAYEALAVTLAAGERVLFLTDGLPEAPDARGEPIGYEALAGLIASDLARRATSSTGFWHPCGARPAARTRTTGRFFSSSGARPASSS